MTPLTITILLFLAFAFFYAMGVFCMLLSVKQAEKPDREMFKGAATWAWIIGGVLTFIFVVSLGQK
jgi:uncharacterized membrane protein YdcZ (DUF606 family)